MTKEELAAKLNGREYGNEVSKEECQEAALNKLVIVYGSSDDLMEFEGAIYNEVGAYNGTTVRVFDTDILRSWDSVCDDRDEHECEQYFKDKAKAKEIKAIWCDRGYSWIYETEIPHATFEIMEDGDKYCRGIVFSMADL
jgi:hypothetical protein